METSLPYQYQDYQQPYSCGFVLQQTDGMYSTHACQYPAHEALVDWQRRPRYQSLHRSSSSCHATLPPRLRFHMPAYRYSLPQRGWRGRRGRTAVHTIRNMSPPALSRCVSTLSSPFIADHQLTDHRTSSLLSSSQHPHAAQLACNVSAGHTASCDQCSTSPNYLNTTTHRFMKWQNCSLLEQLPDQGIPSVLHSNHICRSLVDMSQRPAAITDAICMYIDYLTRDNDRVIGEFSAVDGSRRPDASFSTMLNDHLYRDVFCQSCSFPTSRFREWLAIYSVDLEITDPDGRKLTQATFPGCGCETHQEAGSLTNDLPEYRNNQSQNTGVPWNQSSLQQDCGDSTAAVPRQPVYSRKSHQVYGTRSRRGRGRCSRRPGRGRGRGRGAGRKSDCEYNSASYQQQRQQLTSDVARASPSIVDMECNDDSAVVEFLASLQSDAARRRARQLELQSQQLMLAVNAHDVKPAHGQDKVVEEVVDDELQVDECGVPRCQQVVAQDVAPQSYMNLSLSTINKSYFTNQQFLPVSSPAVGDGGCSMPVRVVEPGDVGKSWEQ